MTDIEIWRTAVYDGKIYEGLYKVSNLGRILSLNYRRTGKAELLKPIKQKNGYSTVCLGKNNIILIHRLVAETFLPNPEGKPCVNHKIEGKKGKKINMVIFNEDGTIDKKRTTIEWATYEENNNYATRNKRISDTQTNDPNKSKKVLQFSKTGDLIREWPSAAECGRNGFNSCNVTRCCRGEQKTHKGYVWKYKGEE